MKPEWSAIAPGGNRSAEGRGVLEGAFQILDTLADLDGAGLTAVATASGLPKATAHRLLQQLCDAGAVERSGGRYRVGHRMVQLGRAWRPFPGLEAAVHGHINALAKASGASVAVCVLRHGQTVVVDGAAGEQCALVPSTAGVAMPWRTAAGKVLIASSQPATMLTLASASWARERETIREQGMAFDREEVAPGVWCAAVPVRGSGGEPVAAIAAMTTPGTRLPPLAQGLRRAGDAITATLRANSAL